MLASTLQGDIHMPFSFIIALDYALKIATSIGLTTRLKKAQRQRRQDLVVILTDGNFADDIAFLSNTTQAEKQILERVEEKVKLLSLD